MTTQVDMFDLLCKIGMLTVENDRLRAEIARLQPPDTTDSNTDDGGLTEDGGD